MSGPAEIPEAKVETRERRISIVWIVPLIAAITGGWLATRAVMDKGPVVTISFATAEGIEAGKTAVKYKSVTVGTVDTVELSSDLQRVEVQAELNPQIAEYLRDHTRFWVVRPRIGATGVSGLSTLVSGAYIQLDPGEGDSRRAFIGLEQPPVSPADAPGLKITLSAPNLGSLGTGSPVLYRQIQVGQVEAHRLKKNLVEIDVYIEEAYAALVRENTRFWNISGVQLTLDANGLRLSTATIDQLIAGGIAFESPGGNSSGEAAQNGDGFKLYSSYEDIGQEYFGDEFEFILYFENSVRGLKRGAPVEFRGLKVGRVLSVALEYDVERMWLQIPVRITLEPGRMRVLGGDKFSQESLYETVDTLVKRGLRARLETGSLLTGAMFVSLDFDGDAPLEFRSKDAQAHEIPTLPSRQEAILDTVDDLLEQFEALPVRQLLDNANATVTGLRRTVETLEAHILPLIDSIRGTAEALPPTLVSVREAIAAAKDTIAQLQHTLVGIEDTIAPGSPIQYELTRALQEVSSAAASVRSLADTINRRPESLLRGKSEPAP